MHTIACLFVHDNAPNYMMLYRIHPAICGIELRRYILVCFFVLECWFWSSIYTEVQFLNSTEYKGSNFFCSFWQWHNNEIMLFILKLLYSFLIHGWPLSEYGNPLDFLFHNICLIIWFSNLLNLSVPGFPTGVVRTKEDIYVFIVPIPDICYNVPHWNISLN